MSKLVIFLCLVLAGVGVNAEWEGMIEDVQKSIELQINSINEKTESSLQVLNGNNERIQAIITKYNETIHNEATPVLNDYYIIRDSAISMQLGINVAECNQIIQYLERFSIQADNYSRDRIALSVENGLQSAEYINKLSNRYIEMLNTYVESIPNCKKASDVTAALQCVFKYADKATLNYDEFIRESSKIVRKLQSSKANLQKNIKYALARDVSNLNEAAKFYIPEAKQCIQYKIDETRRTKNITPIMEDPAETTTQAVSEAVTETLC